MSYIRISNNDGTYSLVHADDEGAYLDHHHLLKKSIKERIRNNGYY